MRRRSVALLMQVVFMLALTTPFTVARAEGAWPASELASPPVVQLAELRASDSRLQASNRLYGERLALAQHSLKGPGWEVGIGGGLTLWGPLIGMLVTLQQGPGFLPCGLFGSGDEQADQACEDRAARRQHDARTKGIAVGAVTTLLGLALVAHGAARIRQIRVARRELHLTRADLALSQSGATVSLGVSF